MGSIHARFFSSVIIPARKRKKIGPAISNPTRPYHSSWAEAYFPCPFHGHVSRIQKKLPVIAQETSHHRILPARRISDFGKRMRKRLSIRESNRMTSPQKIPTKNPSGRIQGRRETRSAAVKGLSFR